MPQSYNYIVTKSRKQLEQEVKEAELLIRKAGTHSSMPGGTHMPIGRLTPTGVPMPGSYETTSVGGDALTGTIKHTWTPSAGIGAGSVGEVPEVPRAPLSDYYPNLIWDPELGMKQKTLDVPAANRGHSGFLFDAANMMAGTTGGHIGAIAPDKTEGSVGRDINSQSRIRRASLKGRRG